ncbi:unnamed protein product [Oppiella nova]|uniref:Uncharacterized protein n=1 Tax=Oppiella nova TaxID=334625 RepID=A0A7R9QNI8_9ACAR|nr:unnamed protein product [Oppiella nova]CAG2169605.1 unnamed protein product [Oppiella nova]
MFDSGYLLASGLSHIMISHMPPKLLRIVNLIGIKGVHHIGMANVTRAAFFHALRCEWSECIQYAELIRLGSRHSPAYTTYCEAIFRYVKSVEDNDKSEMERAVQLLQDVPSVRVRYFGKSVTLEKSAVQRAEKWANTHQCSLLPDMDLLYQWNMLSFIRGNAMLLNRFMDRIVVQIDRYSSDLKTSDYLDNYLTALFYKGIIHRLSSQYTDARKCFKTVFEEEARISHEFAIPPQAVLELGLVELELNNGDEAKMWLKKCTQDYSNYTNENFVHLRVYAALRELGVSTDKQTVNQNMCLYS